MITIYFLNHATHTVTKEQLGMLLAAQMVYYNGQEDQFRVFPTTMKNHVINFCNQVM